MHPAHAASFIVIVTLTHWHENTKLVYLLILRWTFQLVYFQLGVTKNNVVENTLEPVPVQVCTHVSARLTDVLSKAAETCVCPAAVPVSSGSCWGPHPSQDRPLAGRALLAPPRWWVNTGLLQAFHFHFPMK